MLREAIRNNRNNSFGNLNREEQIRQKELRLEEEKQRLAEKQFQESKLDKAKAYGSAAAGKAAFAGKKTIGALDKLTNAKYMGKTIVQAPIKVIGGIANRGGGIIFLVIIIMLVYGAFSLTWAGQEPLQQQAGLLWEGIKNIGSKPFEIYNNYLTQLELQLNGSFYRGVQETKGKDFGIKIVNLQTPVLKDTFEDQPIEIWGDIDGEFNEDLVEKLSSAGDIMLTCRTNDDENGTVSPETISMWDLYAGRQGFTCEIPEAEEGVKTVFIEATYPFRTTAYKEVPLLEKTQRDILLKEAPSELDRFKQDLAVSSGGPATIGLHIDSPFPVVVDSTVCPGEPYELTSGCFAFATFSIYRETTSTSELFKEIQDITISPENEGMILQECSPIRFNKVGTEWKAVSEDLEKYKDYTGTISSKCDVIFQDPDLLLGENRANANSVPIKISADYLFTKKIPKSIIVKESTYNLITAEASQVKKYFESKNSELTDSVGWMERESQRTNIPLTVIAGVASLESNNGKSGLSTQSKNLYGIKCTSSWESQGKPCKDYPKSDLDKTYEPDAPNKYREYGNWEESITDFVNLISTSSIYSEAMQHTDNAAEMLKYIHGYECRTDSTKCVYSTYPLWASAITTRIKDMSEEEVTVA